MHIIDVPMEHEHEIWLKSKVENGIMNDWSKYSSGYSLASAQDWVNSAATIRGVYHVRIVRCDKVALFETDDDE